VERCGSSDEDICAVTDRNTRGLRIDSSIDFELDGPARPINQRANGGDLCTL
jgi:hypothetical protein